MNCGRCSTDLDSDPWESLRLPSNKILNYKINKLLAILLSYRIVPM